MSKKLYFLDPSDTLEQLQDYYFPPYITLAHMFHAPEGWGLHSRTLRQYQIQYVLEGMADYTIQERKYETHRGDLLLHGPGEVHTVSTRTGSPYVCISIVFHFGSGTFPFGELFTSSAGSFNHLLGNYANQAVEAKLSELVMHYHQPGVYHQLQCQNLLIQILLHLSKVTQDRKEISGKKEDANRAKLVLVRNYISSHLRKGFHHAELEKLTGWSRNYIISRFRSVFGMSPMQYLVRIRLEKAKELALQSGLSFGEIANEVGYVNIHAFGKIFKRKMGMSLSEFCATLFTDTPDQ